MPTALTTLLLACASLCYGTSSVLQDRAVKSTGLGARTHLRLMTSLLREPTYLAGLSLSAVGFAAQFLPFREFPLFVVQAAQVANLAVVAIIGIPVLGLKLHARDWLSITIAIAGLSMLIISLSTHHRAVPEGGFRYVLLVWEGVLAIAGYALGSLSHVRTSLALGFLGGLSFATVGVAARTLTSLGSFAIFWNPALYALVIGGILGFVFYADALTRGDVTSTTAAVLLAQIGGSALFGILVLGDRAKPGYALPALVGVTMAVIAALLLARFARVSDARARTWT